MYLGLPVSLQVAAFDNSVMASHEKRRSRHFTKGENGESRYRDVFMTRASEVEKKKKKKKKKRKKEKKKKKRKKKKMKKKMKMKKMKKEEYEFVGPNRRF